MAAKKKVEKAQQEANGQLVAKRCPGCGRCLDCGGPQFVPMPYPVYPQPVAPYRPWTIPYRPYPGTIPYGPTYGPSYVSPNYVGTTTNITTGMSATIH